jgi:putative spermidine/putrescine transport system substrate-binding protein
MRSGAQLAIACTVVLAVMLGGSPRSSGQTESPVTITFTGSGGPLQDAEVKVYFEPYKKVHPNVTILQDSPVNYAKLKAMVESSNVTWDLVEGGPSFGLNPEQTKLLVKFDCSIIPCSHLQPTKFPTTGYRIAENISATALVYRTDVFPQGKEPQSWADFFNVDKFPGKRSLLKTPGNIGSQGILESALLADGVDPAKLYPLDIPRALKKLETIRKAIVFAGDNQACVENIATREATMGICYNGRAYNLYYAAVPVAIQWKTAFHQGGYLFIPKGSKHVQEAMRLAAYMVSDEHAAALTVYFPYGPANVVAAKSSSRLTWNWNPAAHQDAGTVLNDHWWADHNAEAVQAWTEWQLK